MHLVKSGMISSGRGQMGEGAGGQCRAAIQRHLNRLEKWAHKKLTKSNQDKIKPHGMIWTKDWLAYWVTALMEGA